MTDPAIDIFSSESTDEAEEILDFYRANPSAWIEDILGDRGWSKQNAILDSVANNRHTVVKSCHSAGKDWIAARAVLHFINLHDPCLIVTTGLLVAVFAFTHVLTWSLSGFFEPLGARATDRLFAARAKYPSFGPAYDGHVVHVVIDDSSIERREDFYVDREDYARLVRNLDEAGVAIQFHDVIFAAPQTEAGDRLLERGQPSLEREHGAHRVTVGLLVRREDDARCVADGPGEARPPS